MGAAIGASAAAMAAVYTTRKKDRESGAAAVAEELLSVLDWAALLQKANEDAAAYADLQRSWKDPDMPSDEKKRIEAAALAVPVGLVERCHGHIVAIGKFLPSCNKNITSDAKVGIHQLSGAARAAYQTVLVNSPSEELKERLLALLNEIRDIEDEILQ